MKLIKTLFNLLSYIVYIVIAAYLLLVAPILLGWRPVMVLSGSMEPTYHVGSVIYYKETAFDDIQTGDAITFHAGEDSLVTHRVIKKNEIERTFETQGDANETPDSNPVPYDDVAGKASEITIPYAGYFINYGKQIPVIVTMAGIIILSVVLDSLFPDEKKKGKQERAKKNEEKQE